MAISARSIISRDVMVANSVRARADLHQVTSLRDLLVSIVGRECNNRVFAELGPIGAPTGPIRSNGDNSWLLPTRIGHVGVSRQALEWIPLPFATLRVVVEYVGLRVNEPNEKYDDPYLICAVTTLNPNASGVDEQVKVIKVGHLNDVDEGRIFARTITMWDGQLIAATGIQISALGMDFDSGDPDDVKEEVEASIKEAVAEGSAAIGQAFGVGADEARMIAGNDVVTWAARIFSVGIVEVLGLGDDRIGEYHLPIRLGALEGLKRNQGYENAKQITGDMEYTHALPLVSQDGNYTAYFRVETQTIPPIEVTPMG